MQQFYTYYRKKSEDKNTPRLVRAGGGKTWSITLPVTIIRESFQEPAVSIFGRGNGRNEVARTSPLRHSIFVAGDPGTHQLHSFLAFP